MSSSRNNHLSCAPVDSGVRTSLKLGGVLKRDCFKSCEKPNGKPIYPTVIGSAIGQIMTSAQPPSSAHFAASGFLSFSAGCFFCIR